MANRTWSEWFCLPPSVTFKDVEETTGEPYPNFLEFWKWALIFGAALYIFRDYILIPLILKPIGLRAGVRSRPYAAPPPNKTLEDLYAVNRARPPRQLLTAAASRINWSERAVERWLRKKALSSQMTTLEKFCDMGWQGFFYSCFFITGIFIVLPQDYVWDPSLVLSDMPYQRTPAIIWWYCAFDCGFYVTQMYTLLTLDRRHDFYVMLSHHVVVFSINSICLSVNAIKILSLSVLIHEVADIPLSLAKMCDYSSGKKYVTALMAIFTVVWIITRLGLYPMLVIKPLLVYKSTSDFEVWPAFIMGFTSMFVLLFLHCVWTLELAKAIKNKLSKKEGFADGRSSGEELSEDESMTENTKMNEIHEKNNVPRKRITGGSEKQFVVSSTG
ncbi:ceramide synthase 5-like [Hyalella azteca]|uniref:Ceramide synthase 5-like n=1 Tax=Hyalella azteca TaxID=294128 RepID=A0A8B7PG13_HYAAZ|nr:ceramide synthase 5-like [Hyalella azteca]